MTKSTAENLPETKQQRERTKQTINESTVIRIYFPYNKLVLQSVFKPIDTIGHSMKVINS